MSAQRTPPKTAGADADAGQVWRDGDGQNYYGQSVSEELATLQRCTLAGSVLNQWFRIANLTQA